MESSREGLVKRLNGHGKGLSGQSADAADSGTPKHNPPGLVDELAQAMNMARDSLERPQSAAAYPVTVNVAASPLPAMAPPRGLFEDEEDDAAMPIPSTWRTPPEPPRSGNLRDQLRAAGLGFATGLAVIVPVVLVMTGRLGDLQFEALFGGASSSSGKVAQSTAAPAKAPVQVQQRTVSTTIVAPDPVQPPAEATARAPQISPAADAPVVAAAAATKTSVSERKASWTSAVAEGKKRILAGDILGGREVLMPAVSADEPEAIMALAETYDPNMLAAWGVRDVAADVTRARELYERALGAGIEPARARLDGLK